LIGDGFDRGLVEKVRAAVNKAGALFELVAPKIGGALAADGTQVPADHMILGGPSVIFDAVVVAPGAAAIATLLAEAAAVNWIRDAFAHCKVIGVVGAATPLLEAAQVKPDAGVIELTAKSVDAFVTAAAEGRIWDREVTVMGPDKKAPARPVPAKGSAKGAAAKLPPPKPAPPNPPRTAPNKAKPSARR
jgi:catalase